MDKIRWNLSSYCDKLHVFHNYAQTYFIHGTWMVYIMLVSIPRNRSNTTYGKTNIRFSLLKHVDRESHGGRLKGSWMAGVSAECPNRPA